ncbi:MAG: GNAT family N-acetyltransferase [Saccharospirillum sp.]
MSTQPLLAPKGALLSQELASLTPLAQCRGLTLYAFYADHTPAILEEIGRLREVGFRAVGAGRGQALDLDDLDTGPGAYQQLIAWDAAEQEIVALYRFQLGARQARYGDACLRTSRLFEYSPAFREQGLHRAIELGRSVVNRDARRARLGFFALWAGLGALLRTYPEVRYFFGNVSLYKSMNPAARDCLVHHLQQHYRPAEPWLQAREAVRFDPPEQPTHPVVAPGEADTPEQRIRQLRQLLSPWQQSIPPILQSYMGLSTDIQFGETVFDADFGDALEIGLVVPVETINDQVYRRFIAG